MCSKDRAYYTAMSEKNVTDMKKYLHADVEFITPFSKMKGKEAVLDAVQKFTSMFNTLTIRTKFSAGDQAMVVYDVDFPGFDTVPTASLMTFKNDLITKIELFFDARPFEKK